MAIQTQVLMRFERECAKTLKLRLLVFTMGVLSAVFFPLLLVFLTQIQHQQLQLDAMLNSMERSLSQLAEVEKLYAVFVEHHAEFDRLATEIVQRGLVPEDWTVRRINLNKLETTRVEAEVYLDSIAQSPTVYFVPEKFEAKVSNSKDDLFRWKEGGKDSVFLTIFGRYYSRKPQ